MDSAWPSLPFLKLSKVAFSKKKMLNFKKTLSAAASESWVSNWELSKEKDESRFNKRFDKNAHLETGSN